MLINNNTMSIQLSLSFQNIRRASRLMLHVNDLGMAVERFIQHLYSLQNSVRKGRCAADLEYSTIARRHSTDT